MRRKAMFRVESDNAELTCEVALETHQLTRQETEQLLLSVLDGLTNDVKGHPFAGFNPSKARSTFPVTLQAKRRRNK